MRVDLNQSENHSRTVGSLSELCPPRCTLFADAKLLWVSEGLSVVPPDRGHISITAQVFVHKTGLRDETAIILYTMIPPM